MFERFTEPARQVVVLAQDEARRLNHTSLGTETLLLGLLREKEGLAVQDGCGKAWTVAVLDWAEVNAQGREIEIAVVFGNGAAYLVGPIDHSSNQATAT